jgi:hypothetical protein
MPVFPALQYTCEFIVSKNQPNQANIAHVIAVRLNTKDPLWMQSKDSQQAGWKCDMHIEETLGGVGHNSPVGIVDCATDLQIAQWSLVTGDEFTS